MRVFFSILSFSFELPRTFRGDRSDFIRQLRINYLPVYQTRQVFVASDVSGLSQGGGGEVLRDMKGVAGRLHADARL